jgi:protein gp37
MSGYSSIEWTDATWNPTRGCTKVSAGCRNCYAATFAERFRGVKGHPYELGFDQRIVPERLGDPLRWRKPRMVFVDSMSDLFHEAFSFEYIAAVFGVMAASPQHTFQVVTKRERNMAAFFDWQGKFLNWQGNNWLGSIHRRAEKHLDRSVALGTEWPLPNVWLMVSVENQEAADKRIPVLLETPAAVRGVRVEPLLGPVTLRGAFHDYLDGYNSVADGDIETDRLDWVIVGGESGHGARPMHPDWVRSIQIECELSGTPFFFKQWGQWLPECQEEHHTPTSSWSRPWEKESDDLTMYSVGKKAAGRLLDGQLWDEMPRGGGR